MVARNVAVTGEEDFAIDGGGVARDLVTPTGEGAALKAGGTGLAVGAACRGGGPPAAGGADAVTRPEGTAAGGAAGVIATVLGATPEFEGVEGEEGGLDGTLGALV